MGYPSTSSFLRSHPRMPSSGMVSLFSPASQIADEISFPHTTTASLYALSSIPVDSSKKLASSNQDVMSRSLVHLTAPLREKRGHSPKFSSLT